MASEREMALAAIHERRHFFNSDVDGEGRVTLLESDYNTLRGLAIVRAPAAVGTPDEDEIRNAIIRMVRRIHYYGDPPDPRLADDVTGDVADIMERVDAYARRSFAASRPSPEAREDAGRTNPDGSWIGSERSRGPLGID